MIAWLVTVAEVGLFARWYLGRRRGRRRAAGNLDQVVALVDDLLGQVRSGASLSSGFQAAGARHPVEGMVIIERAMAAGHRFVPSLERVADERPGTPLALTAVAVSTLAGIGTGSAAAIERLAETLRAQRSAAAERRAQAAQATFSAVVLGALPIVAVAALTAGSERSRAVYLSAVGGWCVMAAILLVVLGQVWMEFAIWGREVEG